MKKLSLLLAVVLCTMMVAAPAMAEDKTKIVFYGLINEYPSGAPMVDYMKNALPQYDIEAVPVDWGNLETVIKTGIAGGTPADVYCYWPQNIQTFVGANQALDLTPYLEANDGEWKKTFVEAQLDTGKMNDKYYAVPLDALYPMFMVNVELFEKAGLEVKETWTWAEFTEACEALKAKAEVFPLALWRDGTDWYMINSLITQADAAGKLDEYLSMQIPSTDPIVTTALNNAKDLADKGYWYPGEGCLNVARDEAKAAFLQGKVAILAEMSSLYPSLVKEAEAAGIKMAPVCWPTMGTKTMLKGGTDGFFIPANAPHPDEAVECLKAFLSADSQELQLEAGLLPSSATLEISDPSLKKLAEFSQYLYSNAMPSIEFIKYLQASFLQDYILGTKTEQQTLDQYETTRTQALLELGM